MSAEINEYIFEQTEKETREKDDEKTDQSILRESILGLEKDRVFHDAVKRKLNYKRSPEDEKKFRDFFQNKAVDIDPSDIPLSLRLKTFEEEFNDADWKNIRQSPIPLITLYAAENSKGTFGFKEREDAMPIDKLKEDAFIRSLPLVHGTSMEAFLEILKEGKFISNKELYKKRSKNDPKNIYENKGENTLSSDRELGLDQFIFADFGRPHMYHRKQKEITLVIDPAAMNSPGVFMTEKDIADCYSENQTEEYLRGASTPEYFYDSAMKRIINTVIDSKEEKLGRGHYTSPYFVYNNVFDFMQGNDGDRDPEGEAHFSTWEVKLPEISADFIKRVIVRDKENFDYLSNNYSDLFEIIYEPELKPGRYDSLKFRGNYKILEIPGEFEKQFNKIVENEYQERVAALSNLSAKEKEQVAIVYAEGEKIGEKPGEINEKTNPCCFSGYEYEKIEDIIDDIENTNPWDIIGGVVTGSKHGQDAWFLENHGFGYTKQSGPSKKRKGSCVVVIVDRAKNNKELCKIVDIKEIKL